ncbi:hypothetical protein BpHYR1_003096 [Brachionus plicatilis]|uniref:Uncharacterized protein n=1 Tax=Brachionus plicatilis TaxID=10195 RepID=A0A3M7SAB9_BRAPC|nr:hypothetical protein BpHYR1_003096 [Brachionus plicatilis]
MTSKSLKTNWALLDYISYSDTSDEEALQSLEITVWNKRYSNFRADGQKHERDLPMFITRTRRYDVCILFLNQVQGMVKIINRVVLLELELDTQV